jgi:PhzF family phenazine biosynthesis protein
LIQVDAFTAVAFTGNPAAVVLDADALAEAMLPRIGAEMNRPAAFVTAAGQPGADLALRWFAPSGAELTFCGHATLASTHALLEPGRLRVDRVRFATRAGLLTVSVAAPDGGRLLWLEPPVPRREPATMPLAPVLEALGPGAESLGAWARPARSSERDVPVPIAGLHVRKAVTPDFRRLGQLGLAGDIRGSALVAREAIEPASLTHTRFFAPHVGIPEDTASGSAHAALGVWPGESGLLAAEGGVGAFWGEQGDFLGRPSRLASEVHLAGSVARRVTVGGHAVAVSSGRLEIP